MKGYGEPLQYSVFICDLTRAEKSGMQLHLGSIIDHGTDSIVLVNLGQLSGDAKLRFEFMGIHRPLPDRGGQPSSDGGSSAVVGRRQAASARRLVSAPLVP